jgi:hypothetical protein
MKSIRYVWIGYADKVVLYAVTIHVNAHKNMNNVRKLTGVI